MTSKAPQLPSDKLKETPRTWRTFALIVAIVTAGVAALAIGGAVFKQDTSRDGASIVHLVGAPGKPTTPQITHKLLLTDHVAKSTTPPPPPEPEVPAGGNGGGGWVNPDGSVSGPGCPPPYVVIGGSCASPICAVDEYGNEIPCSIRGRAEYRWV